MHYYLLVAICDPESPKLYCLESLGGNRALNPPLTSKFIEVLEFLQKGRCTRTKIATYVPQVPRQREFSNDCGMFCLEYAERIVRDPISFEINASKDSLLNWFPTSSLDNKRSDLAEYIKKQSEIQHLEGGFVEKQDLDLPLADPATVRKQVGNKK